MNISQLKTKWAELSQSPVKHGFISLRISADCYSDIFIGVNKENNRCLILSLPTDYVFDFRGVEKENLSIEFFRDKNYIVLQLTDNNYFDLFDDLVISMYQRIKDIPKVNEYSKEFINTFYKWSEFFEDKQSELLPEIIIKGLIGELLVLKDLISGSNSTQINEVINYWKGPFDKSHDFELDSKDIEVKIKDLSKLDIKISSEYQLENDIEKSLELIVISVENDLNGNSIKDLVLEIKQLINEYLGDSSIFLKAISQKGLTFKNLDPYEKYRYKPINQITYDCDSHLFPKLTKSNIPKEINSINYNLRLSSLSEFIKSKKEF